MSALDTLVRQGKFLGFPSMVEGRMAGPTKTFNLLAKPISLQARAFQLLAVRPSL
jgi:hypothetical protein